MRNVSINETLGAGDRNWRSPEVSLVNEIWAPHFDPVGFLSPSAKACWDAMDVTQLLELHLLVLPSEMDGGWWPPPLAAKSTLEMDVQNTELLSLSSAVYGVWLGHLPRRLLRAYTGLSQHLEHSGDRVWLWMCFQGTSTQKSCNCSAFLLLLEAQRPSRCLAQWVSCQNDFGCYGA